MAPSEEDEGELEKELVLEDEDNNDLDSAKLRPNEGRSALGAIVLYVR